MTRGLKVTISKGVYVDEVVRESDGALYVDGKRVSIDRMSQVYSLSDRIYTEDAEELPKPYDVVSASIRKIVGESGNHLSGFNGFCCLGTRLVKVMDGLGPNGDWVSRTSHTTNVMFCRYTPAETEEE